MNYITDFKHNENLGETYFSILYKDISKVEVYKNTVIFHNL